MPTNHKSNYPLSYPHTHMTPHICCENKQKYSI